MDDLESLQVLLVFGHLLLQSIILFALAGRANHNPFRLESMEKQNNQYAQEIIRQFVQQLTPLQFASFTEEEKHLEKCILTQIVPMSLGQGAILQAIKDILTDPQLNNPKKYLPLLFLSLIDVEGERISDLFKFYYELTSHAIKQLKQNRKQHPNSFWENILEKIYQYGMLLLIGNRSILLNVESLGMRVNSQLFSSKAKEMRLSRLIKIYNCIICIPEEFFSLKKTLYLTLIFTRWQLNENSLFAPSFFGSFTLRTQKKLIRKLKNYPFNCFNQQHILNLIKIVLGGDQLVFSYFLQIKYSYEAIKADQKANIRTDLSVFQALKNCSVIRESRNLFNFIISLLINLKAEQVLRQIERQSILLVCFKYLSGKYPNNEYLYAILARNLLQQRNSVVAQMSFRFIRQQALQYFTVYKLKLLLNIFNVENWKSILHDNLAESVILSKLQRVLSLLGGISRKYSQSSVSISCKVGKYGLSMKEVRNVRAIVLVASFDAVGRLYETDDLQMKIMKLTLGKQVYEVIVTFQQNSESLKVESSIQSKERSASLRILLNGSEVAKQRKQYLRYGQSSYESYIAVSLSQNSSSISFCIDGAVFQMLGNKKHQLTNIQLGDMHGSVRNFYALKTEIDLVSFYKDWCEWNRKIKYVVEALGTQNITYQLNSRKDAILIDNNKTGFFQTKTIVVVNGGIEKSLNFIDVFLQLGGLQTVFFIMERFSRSLIQLRNCQEKINGLIADFFNVLRTAAVLDQTNGLLMDISECFKYLNEFLFLLIKRNRMVRESRNSFLLMSIFQLLIYFRHCKSFHVPQAIAAKRSSIEVQLVLKTLTNFQIWSNCSVALQLFVLSQIQFYIKQKIHLQTFIKQDLHKQLLSGLILFQTSDKNIVSHLQIQHKFLTLCSLLHDLAKPFIIQYRLADRDMFQNTIERDLCTCFAFIKVLFTNCRNRYPSQSQKHAFGLLINYVIDDFMHKKSYFEMSKKQWSASMNVLCQSICQIQIIDSEIVEKGGILIVNLAANDQNYDIWLYRYIQQLLVKENLHFNQGLEIVGKIFSKFIFETTRKSAIVDRIGEYLKLRAQSSNWNMEQFRILKTQLFRMSPLSLYTLSSSSIFIQILLIIRQKLTNIGNGQMQQQEMKHSQLDLNELSSVWRQIYEKIIEHLYSQKLITFNNSLFVAYLLNDLNKNEPLLFEDQRPFHALSPFLQSLKEQSKQSYKNISNSFYGLDKRNAFILLEHCSGWSATNFLLQRGLLMTEKDINIPFNIGQQVEEVSSIGGTVGYCLARSPTPLQLYSIFNIILYRQLSNNLTILSTQANIAIFQYALQTLIGYCTKENIECLYKDEEAWRDVLILSFLLREVLKSLNNSFINKAALISKDIDKILEPLLSKKSQKSKKPQLILQTLEKASQRLQAVLEGLKVDKDMMSFMDMISSKITMIHETMNKAQIIQVLSELTESIKIKNGANSQQQLKKLSIIGIKFFKVARQFFLCKNEYLSTNQKDRSTSQKLPEISPKDTQIYLSYYNFLSQKFDSILQDYNQRGNSSQSSWQSLLNTNEHWFQLQQDPNDITTKFYELDEKQTGPFGFYKLNIRPVRSNHEQLPYPRKKDYSQMRIKKEELRREKEESMVAQRLTIQFNNTTFYSTFSDSVTRQKSSMRATQIKQPQQKGSKYKQYFCEYVTKRGVYGGILRKRKNYIQFCYLGHGQLPKGREYEMSTNKCHQINQLTEWQQKQLKSLKIKLSGSRVFTRRYILRHTALQVFQLPRHRSYFFNLFFVESLQGFISQIKGTQAEIIERRADQFMKAGYTQKWRRGQISNFQYICLINRFSGRSTNDLVQYYVLPWVISNFDGKNGWRTVDKEFYKSPSNFRDLTIPTGKLGEQKFNKLKARLREVDASDREIRFLYGTMYSNPTVLYNFFIRLEPYTSLHWQHQGRKIDHADRLFSGIAQQFSTVLTSSSDMKQLTPQFYYWPQFLRNRNRIDLGKKQKGDDVDAVVLPPWSKSPEQFIFKMRQALQSNYTSSLLHNWIDLIFGYKSPMSVAEEYDNLYHYQCYQRDIFLESQTENDIKIAQISISQFGQVPQQLFFKQHPPRFTRKEMSLDAGAIIHKQQGLIGFRYNQAGLMIWSGSRIVFKKVAISGLYNSFEWTRDFNCKSKDCVLTSVNATRWLEVSTGVLRVMEKGKIRMEKLIQSNCFEVMGNYILFGSGSKIAILQVKDQGFEVAETLYGHRDEIILIKTDLVMDIILSVDRSGYVLIHELTDLRFLRAFQIGTNFQRGSQHLRVCLHRMGYFIFLDSEQTIWIFNYMGELFLEQEIEVRAVDNRHDEQRILQLDIFSHEHAQILLGSSKGNVYMVSFLQMRRFKDLYPYKSFSRLGRNILGNVRTKEVPVGKGVKQMSLIRTVGETSAIYQLLVLFDNVQLVCYSQQREMGSQLQSNQRLKAMGFF